MNDPFAEGGALGRISHRAGADITKTDRNERLTSDSEPCRGYICGGRYVKGIVSGTT